MIFEQSISEWMGYDFAFGIEVAGIFKVLYHFTTNGDQKNKEKNQDAHRK